MNAIKTKLKNGQVCAGTWIQIASGDIAELVVGCGFDWCALDLEHTDIGGTEISNLFRAMKNSDCVPIARVSTGSEMEIRKPLDLGAKGVIVPLVESAQQAERIVSYARYPSGGIRGAAFCRANGWGDDFDRYVREWNRDVLVIVMIETKKGLENIDEILAVEGVDGVFIGPYDLSLSYGIPGQIDSAPVQEGLRKTLEACRAHGKAAGQHIVSPDEFRVKSAVSQGFTFLALGMDTIFLRNGLRKALDTVK